jgi:hypothetical protein
LAGSGFWQGERDVEIVRRLLTCGRPSLIVGNFLPIRSSRKRKDGAGE